MTNYVILWNVTILASYWSQGPCINLQWPHECTALPLWRTRIRNPVCLASCRIGDRIFQATEAVSFWSVSLICTCTNELSLFYYDSTLWYCAVETVTAGTDVYCAVWTTPYPDPVPTITTFSSISCLRKSKHVTSSHNLKSKLPSPCFPPPPPKMEWVQYPSLDAYLR
jgi:hypothetical protein